MIEIEGYFWPDDVGTKYKASLKRTRSLEKVLEICRSKDRLGVVVQAGGSIGVWPRILSKNFQIVYTFEPDPTSFECLCRNVPRYNVFKIPAFLGGLNGCFGIERKSLTSHKVSPSGDTIPMFRIDDLWLKKCDAILLDVEGYEYQALGGAARTIKECKPIILVEARPEIKGSAPDMVEQLLKGHGYTPVHKIDADVIYEAN